MRNYYFFAPAPLRSMRAWKNLPGLRNPSGHRVEGPETRLYPGSFVHRHYIALSWTHFCRTYENRRFAPDDLAKGWHLNRIGIDFEQTRFPPADRLKRLPPREPVWEFDRSEPWTKHFWRLKPTAPAVSDREG